MIYGVNIGRRLGQEVIQEILHLLLGVASLAIACQFGYNTRSEPERWNAVDYLLTLSHDSTFARAWLTLGSVLKPRFQVCNKGHAVRVTVG